MKNISEKLTFILFFSFIIILGLVSFFLPKEEFSETENRYLQTDPEFSVDRLFSGKYMKDIEKYTADHFVGRPAWITTKTNIDLLVGKKESNGVYILGNMLIEKITSPDYDEIKKSVSAINDFAENNKNLKTYVMIAPTSGGIYSDELPKNAPNLNQKEFIKNIYSEFSKDIIPVDCFQTLSSNKEEYIYYRNDHHWTSLGAYYGYTSCIQKMGFTPASLNKYDVEHASNDFKGTLYSKALYNKIEADTIDIYYNSTGSKITSYEVNDGNETKTYDSIYFREYLDKKDKYSVFTGSNMPLSKITTDNKDGKKLLLIKDSYANSVVPFLSEHYSEITILDLRYINTSYKNLVDINSFDDALFLYNASTFGTDNNIKKLNF